MPMRARLSTLLAVGWTLVILLGTSIPLPSESIEKVGTHVLNVPIDKFVHASMFAGFALLWGIAFAHAPLGLLKVGVAGVLLGGLTEAVQAIPFLHRDPDWADFMADSIGVAMGLALAIAASRLLSARDQRQAASPLGRRKSQPDYQESRV
jgi:VanZ family protein